MNKKTHREMHAANYTTFLAEIINRTFIFGFNFTKRFTSVFSLKSACPGAYIRSYLCGMYSPSHIYSMSSHEEDKLCILRDSPVILCYPIELIPQTLFTKNVAFQESQYTNNHYCIPDAKRGYYGFIIVVVRALVRVRVRRDFLLATYTPYFFPDFFHIWQMA